MWATVASFAVRAFLTIGISKLLNRNSSSGAQATGGGRVPVNPNTENKLPVLYGTAFMAGAVTDAKISDNQTIMWYVFAISEVTDTGTITYDEVYWNGNKVTFDGSTAKVTKWTTNGDPPQDDTVVNDHGWIYLFTNGSSSGVNTGGQTAIQILSDPDIPLALRWTATCTMDKVAFAIVKIVFKNPGITNMPTITAKMTNTLTKPGDVMYDYMTNSRYGCGIDPTAVDAVVSGGALVSGSLYDLNVYSDQTISYLVAPAHTVTATQPRYRINGPIVTGNECMTNLTQLTDACDSWLKFDEITSKWSVVINKAYTQSPGAQLTAALYHVTDDNLIGGIDINPTDLNSTYNAVEIQYPDTNIKDATEYQYISLWDTDPAILSPNEPFNQQTISLPVVNNMVQAYYLGARRIYQGREDLTVTFMLDYSGIQIEAGDVIRITSAVYGWDALTGFPDGKLFRVIQVQEAKLAEGSLGANIVAAEYNATVYVDDVIHQYVPADNSGLADPAIIGTPAAPTVATSALTDGNVQTFNVTGVVPTTGQVLYFDFFYGTTSTVADHHLYRTVSLSSGGVSTAGSTQTITTTSFPPGTYYWSVRARNNIAAKQSVASDPYSWAGPNVTETISGSSAGWSSSGALFTGPDTTGILTGYRIRVVSGVGVTLATSLVTTVPNSTQFNMNVAPSTPVVNATIQWYSGGIDTPALTPGSVTTSVVQQYNPVTNTGGLSSSAMAPGAAGFYQRSQYDMRAFPGGAASVTSTSTRNIALTYPGVAVPAGELNTWEGGTWPYSSVGWPAPSGLGYYSPSSSQNPITDTEPYWATWGWYKVISVDLSSDTLLPSEWAVLSGRLSLQTDTANTHVQVCRFACFSPGVYVLQLRTLGDYIIPQATQYTTIVPLNDGSTGAVSTIYEYGWFMRNATVGSTVLAASASLTVKQNR